MWSAFPTVPFWKPAPDPTCPSSHCPALGLTLLYDCEEGTWSQKCGKQSSLLLPPFYVTRMETDVQRCKVIHRRAHGQPHRLSVSKPSLLKAILISYSVKHRYQSIHEKATMQFLFPVSNEPFPPFHLEPFVLSASSREVTYCMEINVALSLAEAIFSTWPAFPLEVDSNSQNTS